MKLIIALAALIAVAYAAVAPETSYKGAYIKDYQSENIGVDGYKFNYETSDGLTRSEQGVVQNLGSDKESLLVTGEASWTDLEGKPHQLSYTAGEDGFKAVGSDIQ